MSTVTAKGRLSAQSHEYPTSWHLAIILLSLALGTLLVAIDTTIISVAIPKISTDFNALDQIGWYGSAYLLTLTALQPMFSNVYKFFHAKAVYLMCILIFEVGSILCAASPSSPIFILGRAIAGIGSAGLIQGALAIVTFVSPLEKRPLHLALVVSVFGIATCLGPLLGGFLTDHASWRWCFWINAPIGAVVGIAIVLFTKLPTGQDADRKLPLKAKYQHFDVLGTITLTGGVICLFLALQWGGKTFSWSSAAIVGLFVGAGLLSAAFGFLQWKRGEYATIPLRILRQRSVLMGSCYLFFIQMSSYTWNYFLPFYFQAVQGASSTTSGIRIMPLAVSVIVAIVVTGIIVTKTGHYVPFIVLGQVISIIGTAFLTRLKVDTPTIQWATYLVIAGLGLGMGMQLPYTAIQVVLSENDVLTGNAIATLLSQLGGAITLCAAESLFVNSLLDEIPKHTSALSAPAVVDAGASNLAKLATSPEILQALRASYAKAVSNTLVYSLVAACAALPFAVCMEWLNVKRVAKERESADRIEKDSDLSKLEKDSAMVQSSSETLAVP